MNTIENILTQKIKPKEKQIELVESVMSGKVLPEEFIAFFESASETDKGSCADAMKHIAEQNTDMLLPYIDVLVKYINYKAPRVKWGIPEAIGNMAKVHPEKMAKAIPNLLLNTTDDKINTTVIKWCAAFALTEIAKHNPGAAKQLMPIFEVRIILEVNSGLKNVYVNAIKALHKK